MTKLEVLEKLIFELLEKNFNNEIDSYEAIIIYDYLTLEIKKEKENDKR